MKVLSETLKKHVGHLALCFKEMYHLSQNRAAVASLSLFFLQCYPRKTACKTNFKMQLSYGNQQRMLFYHEPIKSLCYGVTTQHVIAPYKAIIQHV